MASPPKGQTGQLATRVSVTADPREGFVAQREPAPREGFVAQREPAQGERSSLEPWQAAFLKSAMLLVFRR
jgi:hypothetical protein